MSKESNCNDNNFCRRKIRTLGVSFWSTDFDRSANQAYRNALKRAEGQCHQYVDCDIKKKGRCCFELLGQEDVEVKTRPNTNLDSSEKEPLEYFVTVAVFGVCKCSKD